MWDVVREGLSHCHISLDLGCWVRSTADKVPKWVAWLEHSARSLTESQT